MIAALVFDYPAGGQLGLPLVALVVGLAAWRQRRLGMAVRPVIALTLLRAVALGLLVFLAARPVWTVKEPPVSANRSVVVLLDRSESMSLEENGRTRYQQALGFARGQLLPALSDAKLPAHALLFAEDADPADGPALLNGKPSGKRTNLGGAIARALANSVNPPLAVLALTDGGVNENADDARGLARLLEARTPFVGIGIGSDQGVRTLTLRQVDAPPSVAPNTTFHLAAQFEMMNGEPMPPFDLVLFRDGKLNQKRTVNAGQGSRSWVEGFAITEAAEGVRNYTVQFLPPNVPGLKTVNTIGTTAVRIVNEKEMRVLYVQGALTWDYKFVTLGLRGDPALKLTGLTRTSQQSVFRQNVESAGELLHGFPTALEELAAFRVVVLSNLRPIDLTPTQQELLARFCGELGGGVLMVGGLGTFDASWQGSRLEALLPVVFARQTGVVGLDRPFRLQLTEEALRQPMFQVADNRAVGEVWAELPTFAHYGRVDAAKPGAQVWMLHSEDDGPKGRRILMAGQRYGAGKSAVLCVQNFWRWRLAKDADPQRFDRFWRQCLRYLGEAGRQEVTIHLPEQDLRPPQDVRLVLTKGPGAAPAAPALNRLQVRVEAEPGRAVLESALELAPGQSAELGFRAEKPGVYSVTVRDANKQAVASRAIEIRDLNLEFQDTRRNMETLRQWAALSGGLAVKAEDCRSPEELVRQVRDRADQVRRARPVRWPLGLNGWMLASVLGALGAEWVLRKRWNLT